MFMCAIFFFKRVSTEVELLKHYIVSGAVLNNLFLMFICSFLCIIDVCVNSGAIGIENMDCCIVRFCFEIVAGGSAVSRSGCV